jgi:hypothetical protein
MTKLDLKNGYLQMGWQKHESQPNIWQTFIECMLIRNGTDKAFLATNCRAESVSGDGPIFGGRQTEVSIVKGWDKDYIIRAGAGIYYPFENELSEMAHYWQYDGGVNLVGEERPIKVWAVEDVLKVLREGCENNFFYWSIKYDYNGCNYELITLCKYINFPAIQAKSEYIQPISGYVIFEDQDRFCIAYICAHISNAGKISVEILKRKPIYLFDTKVGIASRYIRLLRSVFALVPFKQLFFTDEFSERIKIDDAEVAIFTYV